MHVTTYYVVPAIHLRNINSGVYVWQKKCVFFRASSIIILTVIYTTPSLSQQAAVQLFFRQREHEHFAGYGVWYICNDVHYRSRYTLSIRSNIPQQFTLCGLLYKQFCLIASCRLP